MIKLIAASAHQTGANGLKALKIANDAELADLAAAGAFEGVECIELHFPKFTDGRAFSQAMLLRRRYRFAGELCATGEVLIDQLLHMARCGFSSAVLPDDTDWAAAERQLRRFADFYQGDARTPTPRFARAAAPEAV